MSRNLAKLNIWRLISLLVAVVMISALVALPTHAASSGECGKELKWSYSSGTLTITGKGEMTDFREPDMAPWYEHRDEITRLVLPEELTSVGNLAFYGLKKLKAVTIPDNVRSIGEYSFASCEGLELLHLGNKLSSIGISAFRDCISLPVLRIPDSVESIGNQAFYRCESIVAVTVPAYVTNMGNQVFAYCTSLIRAEIKPSIKIVPEWTFYGCEQLSEISLPQTVTSVDLNAFEKCENLSNVFYQGNQQTANSVKLEINKDIPGFYNTGYVGVGSLAESSFNIVSSGSSEENNFVQTETTVTENDNVTVITVVEHKPSSEEGTAGSYNTEVIITVEDKKSWDSAQSAVKDALTQVNNRYSPYSASEGTDLTVYLKDSSSVDEAFLKEMAGRDLKIEVVTPSGSTWRVDCEDLKREEVSGNIDYSYTVEEASKDSRKELGTDNCYKVSFNESNEMKTELLVQLPSNSVNTNAFLYQVEEDGTHTRLQAVAVDNDGNAHFYLASVDKDTEYVVGLNVPGEKTDDVIIPDELSDVYGAIERLEKIEYVSTGVRTYKGLTIGDVTLIVLGVLGVTIVAVGVVMFVMNKRKLSRMRQSA